MSTAPLAPAEIEGPPEPGPRKRLPWQEIAAYGIVGAGVLFVLMQHLVSALILVTMLRRGAGNVPAMMEQMADILGSVRLWLGGLGKQFIPEVTDAEDFKAMVQSWLKTHAQTVRAGGLWLGIGLVHMIMGGLLAVLVFFRHITFGVGGIVVAPIVYAFVKRELRDRAWSSRHGRLRWLLRLAITSPAAPPAACFGRRNTPGRCEPLR